MNDALTTQLSAIDDRLLAYLDERGELPVEVIARMHRFANAMVEGSATAELVAADWPEFFDLAAAFVFAYGSTELKNVYDRASLVDTVADGRFVPLDDADRVLLVLLTEELERYPGFPELQLD